MPAGPVVTVCVSTRNRAHLLPRLFSHLEAQTLAPDSFEAVIVDNGSTDDTWDTLQRLAAATPLDVRVLQNPPGKGPAAGRNRAWRAARSPVCAFTDDDCMPTAGWLEAALDAIGEQPVLVAGAIAPPPEQQHLLGPFARFVVATPGQAGWAATANLIARRSDLERVDGFDEGFLNVAGEDTDLALRILEQGVEFSYAGEALVHHGVEAAGIRGLLRDQQRWVDVPAVFARHRWARSWLLDRGLFWKRTHPQVLLLLAGAAVATRKPAGLLLALPWVHERTCKQPIAETMAERVATLPGALVLDVSEVVVMLRGSIRHRELIL